MQHQFTIKIIGKLIPATKKEIYKDKQVIIKINGNLIPVIKEPNNKNKKYAIKINNELIPVNKEIYSAFKRPAWTERKRRKVRSEKEKSLEKFILDGFDIPSNYILEEHALNKLIVNDLLSKLTVNERRLIKLLYYYGFSLRQVARKYGLYHNTIVYQRNRILKKLEKLLTNCE